MIDHTVARERALDAYRHAIEASGKRPSTGH